MSTTYQNRQPEPSKTPEGSLVKEGKSTECKTKAATVQYLHESVNKKIQNAKTEYEDTLIRSFCVLCSKCLDLPLGCHLCQSETVYGLLEESI